MRSVRAHGGMTLIDVVVGVAIMLVIFTGIFGLVRASLATISAAKARAGAAALANSQLEYVRSLSYDVIGTVGGIPAGALEQATTTVLNELTYTVRTVVTYADDPADGESPADSIPTDYKRVKVAVSYTVGGAVQEVSLVSTVAPPGLETEQPGGILRIEVQDADGDAVPGAQVRVQNSNTSPSIDATYFTDSAGFVLLPGTPPSTGYDVVVSKNGYSTSRTYAQSATNVSPSPDLLTVADAESTTIIFAIDILAPFTMQTFSPIRSLVFADGFDTDANVASVVQAVVTGSALTLSGTPGTYPESGSATLDTLSPERLVAWTSASTTASLPPGTDARFQLTDSGGTLLPDAVLPGNSAGFTDTADLSSVSTTTYPSLAVRVLLATDDDAVAPQMLDMGVGYDAGPFPLPDVPVTLTGAKTIGADALDVSIPKIIIATTTDENGVRSIPLEWDLYQVTVDGGYTVVGGEPASPYNVLPGTAFPASLILTTP